MFENDAGLAEGDLFQCSSIKRAHNNTLLSEIRIPDNNHLKSSISS